MNAPNDLPLKLTSFSHGGGCGCKIAPGVLGEILKGSRGVIPPQLLVGIETADDAAVYQINDQQALIATTDFFMPIVDDPYDFGRIAATNAISDVYAMGGTPIMALALLAMPVNKLPIDVIRKIVDGGQSVCAAAGIPIAGGHTIDSVEPIYGLVVMGLVHPSKVKKNADARPGDVLILGKPLGVGIYSAALKKDRLDADGYRQMIANTTQLNTPGRRLADMDDVHALTDVTGFGLLGHLNEICLGSQLRATLDLKAIPLLPDVAALVGEGFVTGASGRNWAGYGQHVRLNGVSDTMKALLTDPQTSGGLLVACAPDAAPEVLKIFADEGFERACVIGQPGGGQRHRRRGLARCVAGRCSWPRPSPRLRRPARATGVMTDWKGPPAAPPIELYTPDGDAVHAGQPARQGRARELLGDLVRAVRDRNAVAAARPRPVRAALRSARGELQGRPGAHQGVHRQERHHVPDRARHRRRRREGLGRADLPCELPGGSRPARVKHVLIGGADWTSPTLLSTIRALL